MNEDLDDDTCALCNGTGVIMDADGDEQECDECDGTGVIG